MKTQPIAIIGMALRIPGASSLQQLWQHILNGTDCLTRSTIEQLRRDGVSSQQLRDPSYIRSNPLLNDLEYFDSSLFGIAPFEAERTDPAHRLFLECAWEGLESAGVLPGRNGEVTGVFAGTEGTYLSYLMKTLNLVDEEAIEPAIAMPLNLGNTADFVTSRVSHKLDLIGPAVTVLAACSTSLLATHLAIQSLRKGECKVAIAGGASVDVPQTGGYLSGVKGMLSTTGRIRPFDAAADGTVFGNGAGVVVLKTLEDALADGNPIHAIIRGSAISNDGNSPEKESFVAPSPEGQIAAISGALTDAGVEADTIGYVEAHGTGTLIGDPIEASSLIKVYQRYTQKKAYCALGCVKANVGHLRNAAGVVGLIKACLLFKHHVLPPTANFETPNPRINFDESPLFINTKRREWIETSHPRRVGVSAFGFGGSNAHVILEEYQSPKVPASSRKQHLLVFSAKSQPALSRRIFDLGIHLQQNPHTSLADVAYTLQCGRQAFDHRTCIYVDEDTFNPEELLYQKEYPADVVESENRPLVFLFPGQGSQYPGMGRQLYEKETVYRKTIDECAEFLQTALHYDIRTLINSVLDGTAETLRKTLFAQPALFMVEYALARLYMSWGLAPTAMLGHSVGELVAACLANVFSLNEALRLFVARGQAMQQCEPGAMAAVFLSLSEIEKILPSRLELAAVNAPHISVVSGPTEEVARFTQDLAAKNISSHPLEASHAFHSWMMEPALPKFLEVVNDIELKPPQIPIISNITGLPITPEQATCPKYWSDQVRHTVFFSKGVEYLLSKEDPAFIEMGPGHTLTNLVLQHRSNAKVFTPLRNNTAQTSCGNEQQEAMTVLGQLWNYGVHVRWQNFAKSETRCKIALPTYPFQKHRYWLDADEENESRSQTSLNLYIPGWRKEADDETKPHSIKRPYLIFRDTSSLGDAVIAQLQSEGVQVISLLPGSSFQQIDATTFSVRPAFKEDLLAVLEKTGELYAEQAPMVLHMWSITGSSGLHNSMEAFKQSSQRGFYTLVALIQAAFDFGINDELDIVVVADGLTQMDKETGPLHTEKAGLLGPCRGIPVEFPNISIRCVDIPLFETENIPSWQCHALIKETRKFDKQLLVALRPDGRYVEELYSLPSFPLGKGRLREGGTVLITGAMGGIGLTIAKELFESFGARLILTSRWTPPPKNAWGDHAGRDNKIGRALKEIMALEKQGAEILIATADVSDFNAFSEAISKAQSHFGKINGIVHLAGIADPAPLLNKTPIGMEKIFEAKVYGAYNLEAIFSESPLDFFVHFSSRASYYPGGGQVDYTAANAVLDALARRRTKKQRGLSCAIGYGMWEEVGMGMLRFTNKEKRNSNVGMATKVKEVETIHHPLLQTRCTQENNQLIYRGLVSDKEHWVADEHRFDGRPLLSATTIIDCVHAAFSDHVRKDVTVELTQIVFVNPLFIHSNGTEIEITFTPNNKDEKFEVHSRPYKIEAEWHLNTTGCASVMQSKPPTFEVMPHKKRVNQPGTKLRAHDHKRVSYGPRWGAVAALEVDGDVVWTRLRLANTFLDDCNFYGLHPALFDLSLALTVGGIYDNAVPYSFGSIRIYRPLGAEFLFRGQQRSIGNSKVFDLQLCDLAGNTLVMIEDYVMLNIEGSNLTRAANETVTRNYRAVVSEPGNLESIQLKHHNPRLPNANEVQIEVMAAGLNFRDVLMALDQLPALADDSQNFGVECSGVITAVGEEVQDFQPGDSVVAIADHCFASHVTVDTFSVASLPDHMSFENGAGIPIVFMTADLALNHLVDLKKGERILIHAAAGGVGLAAVQLAQKIGAEIYATAGSPEKREYLQSIGVEHVMDSRSLEFVDETLKRTQGEGVKVVLNSLGGKFIPASLGLLSPFGHFIEIGKRDIYADTKIGLHPFRNCLNYSAVDLGKMIAKKHPLIPELFHNLMDRFARDKLSTPLTSTIPFSKAVEGFQRMSRAGHIGKIVFKIREDMDPGRSAKKSFRDIYGKGIFPIQGQTLFRHLLSSDETLPYVMAIPESIDGLGVADQRAKLAQVSSGERTRPKNLRTSYRAPTNAVEEKLTHIWEKALGIIPIGVEDNFFELGGDSLKAVVVQFAISKKFNFKFSTNVLFDYPKICSLAELIVDNKPGILNKKDLPV